MRLDEVSELRPGQSFAFVMDTSWCAGALELADRADLLVCEATFLSTEQDLATRCGHLTAREAGTAGRAVGRSTTRAHALLGSLPRRERLRR